MKNDKENQDHAGQSLNGVEPIASVRIVEVVWCNETLCFAEHQDLKMSSANDSY